MEDIDAILDELTSVIDETWYTSGPKTQPAKQPKLYVPATILVDIREKNTPRREWQVERGSSYL